MGILAAVLGAIALWVTKGLEISLGAIHINRGTFAVFAIVVGLLSLKFEKGMVGKLLGVAGIVFALLYAFGR